MIDLLTPYLPGFADLRALALLLLVIGAFVGLGSLVSRQETPVEIALLCGWAIMVLVATLGGVFSPFPLRWFLFPLTAAGLLALLLHLRRLSDQLKDAGRLLLVGLPLLLLVAAASASQWDEFAHWLVNQRYLLEVGTFPRRGLPESTTGFAAYPYGLALVGFLVSAMMGSFVENAGALLNTLLILVLGASAVRAFRIGAGSPTGRISWVMAAMAVLGATLLNPTFVPKLVFTTYADWTTSVLLGVAALLAWRMITAAHAAAWFVSRVHAVHLGLALATLLALKQPNLILAALLVAGIVFVMTIGPRPALAEWVRLGWRMLGPPVIGYAVWRYHVLHEIPGREFGFMALANWLWNDLCAILGRMLLIASKKGGYFGLMLVATVIAGRAFYRRLRGSPLSDFGVLSILAATVFVGFNFFLYVAYVGSFGPGEGQNAASFWRYNTQLGGVALIFLAMGGGVLWSRVTWRLSWRPWIGAVVVTAVIVAPVAAAPKLRFDLNPVTRHVRSVGVEIAALVPADSSLVVIDPADNGKRALLLRYEMRRKDLDRLLNVEVNDPGAVRSALQARDARYAWIHVPTPALNQAFALEMAALSSYLLGREPGGPWRIVRSWPYPGYTDPIQEDD